MHSSYYPAHLQPRDEPKLMLQPHDRRRRIEQAAGVASKRAVGKAAVYFQRQHVIVQWHEIQVQLALLQKFQIGARVSGGSRQSRGPFCKGSTSASSGTKSR